MNRFKRAFNSIKQAVSTKARGKPIKLSLGDKHEPFGMLSIEKIKTILDEEEFEELQSLFFYMMRDLKIASVVLARRMPLLGLDYTIKSDNKDFVEWATDNVDLDELINQMCSAVYYGISLSNAPLTVTDLKLTPTFSLVSPRFIYAHKDKTLKKTAEHLYVKESGSDKKLFINKLDQDLMVFHKHAIDIGEITDFSLASKLVWYFSLKHIALSHNLQYFDNVATPPLIAKSDGNSDDDIVDSLYALKSSSVGVFGKDDIIEYLKVDSKADFLNFIEYIDRQITTLVSGSASSTGDSKSGSYGKEKVLEGRKKEIVRFDAKLIAKTITAYLNRLEVLNFSNPKGIKFEFNLKDKKDLEKLSKVVKNLSDSGFELDPDDIQEQFGLKILGKKEPKTTEKEDNALQPTRDITHDINSCQCASCKAISANNTRHDTRHFNAQQNYTDHLDSQKPSTKTAENELLKHIQTTLKHATSYEQAYELLLENYQDMPTDELESALFKAIGNSQILGDAEVQSEDDDD